MSLLPSDIWFAAAIAAEDRLPPKSRALIEQRDAVARKWASDGYPMPLPSALVDANRAIDEDEFASVAMQIRRCGNNAVTEQIGRGRVGGRLT